jgi:fluoride exporter
MPPTQPSPLSRTPILVHPVIMISVLAIIAAGGAVGAIARDLVSQALPGVGFPVGTFMVNLSGCLLIGVLMVSIIEVWRPHRLVRPFLGVGVLGGYTTFSTYSVDTLRLIQDGNAGLAVTYFIGTAVGALLAVQLGVLLGRWFPRMLRHRRPRW